MKPKVKFYCLEWHINKSGAFKQFLINPISKYLEPELIGWDGTNFPNTSLTKFEINVFCQLAPPLENIEKRFGRVIWVPMWDKSWDKTQNWWNLLPKKIKIVAFSKVISEKAHQAGLSTFDLTYFPNPSSFKPVDWKKERVLCYWNRRGLAGPNFLERLVKEFKIQRVLFMEESDPYVPYPINYRLPERIGHTIIERIEKFQSPSDYLKWINRANFFLAPRMMEGVGLTFLEAMAQGSAVIALDAPTMNEYIIRNIDGVLIPQTINNNLLWMKRQYHDLRCIMLQRLKIPAGNSLFFLSTSQDWSNLKSLDFEKIGNNAREKAIVGHELWLRRIPPLAQFILGE